MLSESTRKWKKRVNEAESDAVFYKKEAKDAHELIIELRAKLDRFEEKENEARLEAMDGKIDMKSQVQWLRGLVESLTVSPEVTKALTTKSIRFQEMDFRRMSQDRRDCEHKEKEWMLKKLEKKGGEI